MQNKVNLKIKTNSDICIRKNCRIYVRINIGATVVVYKSFEKKNISIAGVPTQIKGKWSGKFI